MGQRNEAEVGGDTRNITLAGATSEMGMFRQRPAIDLVRTHALPANSRFSVDTFTFSPSLMKRGTRISRPVSSRADLGHAAARRVAPNRRFRVGNVQLNEYWQL